MGLGFGTGLWEGFLEGAGVDLFTTRSLFYHENMIKSISTKDAHNHRFHRVEIYRLYDSMPCPYCMQHIDMFQWWEQFHQVCKS